MKRTLLFLLASLLLAACGRSNDASDAPAAPAANADSNATPTPVDSANVETLPKDTTSRWPE